MLRLTRNASLLLLVAALALDAGCSALIDSSRYVGNGDGDGGVDPNGPSMPGIDLTPDPAHTDDVLTVSITTESTDPLGTDTVTYEYRWLRDGTVIDGQTASTLPADQTTKGDVIRVEVTPVAGTRRGAGASAEVTIENSPPVLTSIGLDTYEPMVGERIRAFAGSVVDADGDAGAVFFQWYQGDTAIAGATSATLDTAPFAAGSMLRLEAWASDGDEGPHVEVGPIALLESTTRWRQLVGYQDNEGLINNSLYDAPHRRVVMYAQRTAFELVPNAGDFRVAHLSPTGTPPPAIDGPIVLHDAAHRRMLVVDPQDPQIIYALDLTHRGAETWSTTTASGTGPMSVFASSTFYDDEGGMFWFYGGVVAGDGTASNRLFTLSVRTPGAEAWAEHSFSGTPPPALIFAEFGRHPTEANHAILLGGMTALGGGSTDPSLLIFDIDLSGTDAVATQLTASLPNPVVVGSAAPLPGTSLLVIAGGASDITGSPPTPSGVFTLDVTAGLFRPLAELPDLSASGFLVPSPDDAGQMIYGPQVFRGAQTRFGTLQLSSIDVDAGSVEEIATYERPPPTAAMSGSMRDRNVGRMYFGDASGATNEVWELSFDSLHWEKVTIAPDATSGTSPTPRSGIVTGLGRSGSDDAMFFGGSTDSGPADTVAWHATRDDHWRQMRLAAGESAPSPREGHAIVTSGCGQLTMFGGRDGTTGTALSDSYQLQCDTGDLNCRWVPYSGAASPPSARWYPSAFTSGSSFYVFGGWNGFSALGDLQRIYACGFSFTSWEVPAVSGAPPAARWGASATVAEPDTFGNPDVVYVVGGATASWFDPGTLRNDVFRLTIGPSDALAWEAVTAAGTPPEPRAQHITFYDQTRHRLLVYGGRGEQSDTQGDLWELVIR